MKAAHFSPDIQELFELLARHAVRFMVVGGEAVIYHGYPRLTGDVDIWYEQTARNVERTYLALADFWGGSVPGLAAAADLMGHGVIVQFGRPPHRIDLLSSVDGVTFDEAWARRVEEGLECDDGRRIPVAFIGIVDLIANKRASGRHKDLDDVQHLVPFARS